MSRTPKFEAELETAMLKCLDGQEKLGGKTVMLVDVSGSMSGKVSGKSEISRLDAACGVAMMLREMCEAVEIYTFSNSHVFVNPRRGFALADAIKKSQLHRGTFLGNAVAFANQIPADRMIVITDEQSAGRVPAPKIEKSYMINIAPYKNGVGYNHGWTHIDGWSEKIVDYVAEVEKLG